MITARAPTSVQATILRRSPSPLQTDQSPSVSITTLPSIHKMLHPQSRSDILQRPRGSTLPSYATQGNSGHPLPNSVESGNRIHRKERSSTISGRPHQEESQHNITYAPPHPTSTASPPPTVGISLPPIRLGNDLPASPTFSGLPPIKAMLPSPSHMLSLETRSPVSPPSPHSIVQSSSSWSSSQANNSASSGDMTGRYHHRPPMFDPHHRRRASPNSSYSPPPPSQYDDEPGLFNTARSREIFDDPDGSSGYNIQRHIQPKPSDSSLLTLTAPRRSSASSTITRLGLERGYGSDNYLGQSRSREAIPEDVAITSGPSSSSIIFPSSAPSAGRHIPSHRSVNISERSVNYETSSQPGRNLANEPIVTGTFDISEGEGRFRPGETSGGKKRRSRATQEQLDILNGVYQRTPFPTTVERTELAQQLGMTPRSVQIWFQNKRQGAKNNETRRRELPPLISNISSSPQMPNLVPLTLAPPAMSQSPPSPVTLDARSISYGPERRDSFENGGNLRGRARRRRMSVNDLLSHDTRDEVRSGMTVSRHISRQRVDDKDL